MGNQRGATFIEVVILIAILTLLTSIFLLDFKGTKTQLEFDQFIDQLQRDINWALHYADIRQQVVFFHFAPERYMYYFKVGNLIMLKRNYNTRFEIDTNLTSQRLIIDATGLVSNFGTLTIKEKNKKIATLRIQMHTGIIREERY